MSTKTGLFILGVALLLISSCNREEPSVRAEADRGDETQSSDRGRSGWFGGSSTKVPAGTVLRVRLGNTISSETAHAGDGWEGVVTSSVVIGDKTPIPAGSSVHGVVSRVQEAQKGTRAMVDLAVRSIGVEGKTYRVSAGAEPVYAGSARARNVGAIAGGAAAGALIGKAVGGDNKDAAVGGIIGGAAAGGVVAASKGYQVVLKPGTVFRFTLNEQVAVR